MGHAYEIENAYVQSRSYGIWSSFLHLLALRTLEISFYGPKRDAWHATGAWDMDTFCAKTVRNIIAAVPCHVSLVGFGDTGAVSRPGNGEKLRSATGQELKDLYSHSEHVRGQDAKVWKTEMECMFQPPASPSNKYKTASNARLDELVTVR